MPDMNFSAEASNNHDNLYEQGIWGKTKTRVEPGAYDAESKATAAAEERVTRRKKALPTLLTS